MIDPCWAERAHVPENSELLYIISGSVELQMGSHRYAASPGDVLLVPKGVEHRYDFDPEKGLHVFMVFFEWDAADAYFGQVTNDVMLQMRPRQKKEMVRLVERLHADALDDSPANHLVMRSRLMTILMMALREAWHGVDPERSTEHPVPGARRRRALMLAARRYLETHYARPISLEDIAQDLNVSTFYLSHVFSDEHGSSLFTYLTTLRMKKARALLATGRHNVSEVALAVGYENSNYFAKVFRKHYHHPPSDFLGVQQTSELATQDIT